MCILRVEIRDDSYTLVPADEDEGAGGDVKRSEFPQTETRFSAPL
jgi:hypothetical protein